MSSWVMQINQWLLNQRAANSEELPAFPSVADGGSGVVLQQAAAAAAAEPPATAKGSAKATGKTTQASSTPAKKSKDPGSPILFPSPTHEENYIYIPGVTDFMACCAWTMLQHWFRDERYSVSIEPATLRKSYI